MRSRIPTRWVVVAFVLLGVLLAMVLIVRDLGDGDDVQEEDGTVPTPRSIWVPDERVEEPWMPTKSANVKAGRKGGKAAAKAS